MARTKSSARWLREHFTDEYVRRAQAEGYRSRAVYKLLEIRVERQHDLIPRQVFLQPTTLQPFLHILQPLPMRDAEAVLFLSLLLPLWGFTGRDRPA